MAKNRLLFAILALGFLLRIYGIWFGLPELYHADEPIVVNHAMAYGLGDLNPHFFKIPPLVSYILFFFYGVYFAAGRLLGIFASAQDFAIAFLKDPTVYYLIGRIFFGAILGTLTVWAVYCLGKRLFSPRAGILSALFLAGAFLHVQNSHYIYADIPMVLFIVLTCIASFDRKFILAGIFAGLATAFKYNAALVGIVMLAAYFAGKKRGDSVKLLLGIFTGIVVYAACNPFSILDFKSFVSDLSHQAGFEAPLGALYHLRYSLAEGVGPLLLFFGLLGMFLFILKRDKTHFVYLSFPILFYLVLIFFSQPHERYVLPLVPFVCVYAAGFLDKYVKNITAIAIFAAVLIAQPLSKSVYSDYLFTKTDTRAQAKAWIEKNVPAGARIAVDHSFFCPKLAQTSQQLEQKFNEAADPVKRKRVELELKSQVGGPAYNVYYLKEAQDMGKGFLFERPQLGYSVSGLRENVIQYVIVHVDIKDNLKNDFYRELQQGAALIKEFSPYKDKNKQFSDDVIVQTGGPFLGKELFSRDSNGYTIKIFEITK